VSTLVLGLLRLGHFADARLLLSRTPTALLSPHAYGALMTHMVRRPKAFCAADIQRVYEEMLARGVAPSADIYNARIHLWAQEAARFEASERRRRKLRELERLYGTGFLGNPDFLAHRAAGMQGPAGDAAAPSAAAAFDTSAPPDLARGADADATGYDAMIKGLLRGSAAGTASSSGTGTAATAGAEGAQGSALPAASTEDEEEERNPERAAIMREVAAILAEMYENALAGRDAGAPAPLPDEVTFNLYCTTLVRLSRVVEALEVPSLMRKAGIQPSVHVYSTLLSGAVAMALRPNANTARWGRVIARLQQDMRETDQLKHNLYTLVPLLRWECAQGQTAAAGEILRRMKKMGLAMNSIVMNVMVEATLQREERKAGAQAHSPANGVGGDTYGAQAARRIVAQMQREKVEPDASTVQLLFDHYVRVGRFDRALGEVLAECGRLDTRRRAIALGKLAQSCCERLSVDQRLAERAAQRGAKDASHPAAAAAQEALSSDEVADAFCRVLAVAAYWRTRLPTAVADFLAQRRPQTTPAEGTPPLLSVISDFRFAPLVRVRAVQRDLHDCSWEYVAQYCRGTLSPAQWELLGASRHRRAQHRQGGGNADQSRRK
jgi:hypothetical protein